MVGTGNPLVPERSAGAKFRPRWFGLGLGSSGSRGNGICPSPLGNWAFGLLEGLTGRAWRGRPVPGLEVPGPVVHARPNKVPGPTGSTTGRV